MGMTYRISGLDPAPYQTLFGRPVDELAVVNAQRMVVTDQPGFPCRVRLDDVEPGRSVLLLNHLSVATGPYRARHAIFIEEGAEAAAVYRDTVPPALNRRVLSVRAFDHHDLMMDATLAQPGEADAAIRRLLADERVRYIHTHNAVRGCFAATVERVE